MTDRARISDMNSAELPSIPVVSKEEFAGLLTREQQRLGPVPQVYAGIMKVTQLIGQVGVAKTKDGTFGTNERRKYRSIDEVYNNLNECLVEAGIIIIPSSETVDYKRYEVEKSNQGSKYIQVTYVAMVTITWRVMSVYDGSFVDCPCTAEGFDSSDKAIGKGRSYSYKNTVIPLFCIPVEGNAEPENDDHKRPQGSTPPVTAPRAAPAAPAPDERAQKREQQRDPSEPKSTIPVVELRQRKDAGTSCALLTDVDLAAYVRQLHHMQTKNEENAAKVARNVGDGKAPQAELDKLLGFKTWFARVIPPVVEYTEQKRGLAWKEGEELKDPPAALDISIHPDTKGQDIKTWDQSQLTLYISWVTSKGDAIPDGLKRIAVAEMLFEMAPKGK